VNIKLVGIAHARIVTVSFSYGNTQATVEGSIQRLNLCTELDRGRTLRILGGLDC
jgi:hypothetical protein